MHLTEQIVAALGARGEGGHAPQADAARRAMVTARTAVRMVPEMFKGMEFLRAQREGWRVRQGDQVFRQQVSRARAGWWASVANIVNDQGDQGATGAHGRVRVTAFGARVQSPLTSEDCCSAWVSGLQIENSGMVDVCAAETNSPGVDPRLSWGAGGSTGRGSELPSRQPPPHPRGALNDECLLIVCSGKGQAWQAWGCGSNALDLRRTRRCRHQHGNPATS